MTLEACDKERIDDKLIQKYWEMGLKPVFLGKDGTPIAEWTSMYENFVLSLKQLLDFFHENQTQIYGIATCFGEIHIREKDTGMKLYLNNLDIDSKNACYLLDAAGLIEELKKKTFAVKTSKPYGYHFYWFSHERYRPIHTVDCLENSEFEIKTDKSGGLATLPPSPHRKDENFHYYEVGNYFIATDDHLYSTILNYLRECCLKEGINTGRVTSDYEAVLKKFGLEKQLGHNVGAVISDDPPQLVIEHERRIKIANIDTHYNKAESRLIHDVKFKDTVLGAVPRQITVIRDPLLESTKYEVELIDSNNATYSFGPLPFDELVKEIEKTPLCFNRRNFHGYLAAVVQAYNYAEKIEKKTEIEAEGVFSIDGKLVTSKLERRTVDSAQARAAVDFISELQKRFYVKPLDISRLAYVLKLITVAPFDFARRQSGAAMRHGWITRPDLAGRSDVGKSLGYGGLFLRAYRKDVHDDAYMKSSGSLSTAPRFIEQTGHTTLPVILEEMDCLDKWENDGRISYLLEVMKNQCTKTNPRDILSKDSQKMSLPSLAFPIPTHNSDPVQEDGFTKRFTPLIFTESDVKSEADQAAYDLFMSKNADRCAIIGDFAISYALNNPDILENDWLTISKTILRELYKLAGVEYPKWLDQIVENTGVKDVGDRRREQVAAFFLEMINKAWSQNRHDMTSWQDTQTYELEDQLELLLKHHKLPHLRKHSEKGICVMSSIREPMKKAGIIRMPMEQLADLCGFEHGNAYLGGGKNPKVVYTAPGRFVNFILTLSPTSGQEKLKT